jgi:hypothetical protein
MINRLVTNNRQDIDDSTGVTITHSEAAQHIFGASISGRVATGPRAGRRVVRVGDGTNSGDAAIASGRCCASIDGFSVHADVCVPARDRMWLRASAEIWCSPAVVNREAFAFARWQASL